MSQQSFLLLPGMQIGDYSIIHKIGNGGFGTVYKVENNSDSKQYALKIIKNNSTIAIHQEIEIAAMLGKPDQNLSRQNCFAYMHDIGETENFTYYVSELLGPSLDLMVNRQEDDSASQSVNFKKILHYAKEMLLCLKELHSMHIIHCDVKPANFLIRNDTDGISLIDFGLSKVVKNYKLDQKASIQNFFEKLFQFNISIKNKNNLFQKADISNKLIKNRLENIANKFKVKANNDLNQCKKKLLSFCFNNNCSQKDKASNKKNNRKENRFTKKNRHHFKGTYKYASYNSLNGGIIGPRDDLISWFYSILEIYSGSYILPWEPLAQEIMANRNDMFTDSNMTSDSACNSNIDRSPLIKMKKMKEYFEGGKDNYDNQEFILPEQLCQIIQMPLEMAAAFRCILALKPGEIFYPDSIYDEIVLYIDSAIQSFE